MELRGMYAKAVCHEEKPVEIRLSLSELNHVIQTLHNSLCERRDICDITDTSPACDSEYRALASLLDQLRSSYLFYVQDPSAKDTLPF